LSNTVLEVSQFLFPVILGPGIVNAYTFTSTITVSFK